MGWRCSEPGSGQGRHGFNPRAELDVFTSEEGIKVGLQDEEKHLIRYSSSLLSLNQVHLPYL